MADNNVRIEAAANPRSLRPHPTAPKSPGGGTTGALLIRRGSGSGQRSEERGGVTSAFPHATNVGNNTARVSRSVLARLQQNQHLSRGR
jgi:hypothetical protein